ncbi:flagellar hook protein FlgK [Roseibium aquae]|uniref:Flagellar hook-associated protein 1 n=1 Tax=Roseibium aquae TaxID=1323746 RepID=A0A916TL70_9HYPH|nr:flagellar hook-associated protein FlgK [Roseibium aquae]GGB53869.1 flagellar hook protein FlgK [Roseibium aquae]
MSLSVALQVAQSALAARQSETSVISRNVSGAQDPGYSRKSVMLSSLVTNSGQAGGVRVEGVARAANEALYTSLLRSTSSGTAQQAVLDGLSALAVTINDTELEMSPAAKLGDLKKSLQAFASEPNNTILAQSLLSDAQTMAQTLNNASRTVQETRAKADADIAASVAKVNRLLDQFEGLNDKIVQGNQIGTDITDALDERDRVLLSLSEEIGISTLSRADGDMVITTDSGITLFETTARAVTFETTFSYAAGTVGNAVFIDGVPAAGPNAVMELKSGRIKGLADLRDNVATTYQSQLDEIARGLIVAFREADQSGGGGPDQQGLFVESAGAGVPVGTNLGLVLPAGLTTGLASTITINRNADPDQGGDLDRLRNGGLSDPVNYDYNPANLAGYSDRIQGMLSGINTSTTFDPNVGLDPTDSVSGFAASSVSWLEARRSAATNDLEVQSVIVNRTAENLSNTTGVNIDEEMTRLLDIERAFAAAAKLITTVDRMLDDLMAVAR